MSSKHARTCLVISYGPVPTPQYQKIEGGGMRAWGLAKGLQKNGLEVTVGVNNSFPQDLSEHEGLKIINWSPDEAFAELINSYDAVVVSYCMGSDSVFIAENINDNVLLVLDAYVPIYVEVSARDADDMGSELRNYMEDIARFNRVLKRGDYFICANQTQKIFYTGVLGSLGIINPRSYRQDRILVVPFGIHNEPVQITENPYTKLGIKNSDKTVLWFGGLYPWFRVEDYLDAILQLSKSHPEMKFVFVGGKNPFNNNPDLLRQYTKAVAFAEKNKLTNKNIFFVDWVDFDTRANWYKYADFVVSLNQPGEENQFSWRTRVMDYVWGDVVTITNGADSLGEELIQAGAAIRLESLSASEIVKTIEAVYAEPGVLKEAVNNLRGLKHKYYWENVTRELAEKVSGSWLPFADEKDFKKANHITESVTLTGRSVPRGKISKAAQIPSKLIRHAREKGVKRSVKLAAGIVRNQLVKRSPARAKEYIFISNLINNSGAPLVLLQIIDEVRLKYGARHVRVLAPSITPDLIRGLSEKGVRYQKTAVLSPGMTGLQLSIKKDDFVFMNTAAIYENYRHYIFNLLNAGRLNHAYWFIHEDLAQLTVVSPSLKAKEHISKIQKLAKVGRLTILVPSKRVKDDYDKLFGIDSVRVVPLRVTVPERYQQAKPANEYARVNFLLSGYSSDGRKGQLIALAAFQRFIDLYRSKNPEGYRDFSVHFVAVGNDYVSTQIKTIGSAVLGKKLHIYPALLVEEALEVTKKCNAVICCSLNETFALYVAEGMFMGHIVLRNNSAGMEEQLHEGKNGYYIDSQNINQFAKVIEKILNKKTMTNSQLRRMGAESKKIISPYASHTYLPSIDL